MTTTESIPDPDEIDSEVWDTIPRYMRAVIYQYAARGNNPGDFLSAIICNDLNKAVFYADPHNVDKLHIYVRWLEAYMPRDAFGGKSQMRKWTRSGGLAGIQGIGKSRT